VGEDFFSPYHLSQQHNFLIKQWYAYENKVAFSILFDAIWRNCPGTAYSSIYGSILQYGYGKQEIVCGNYV
jgi:hypothetical protein